MMQEALKVYCVRTGDKFGVEYVYKLRNALVRSLDVLFEFICMSDTKVDGVQCIPAPLPKWWSKVMLFETEVHRPCLFFDLDTVLVGDVTPLADAVMRAQSRALFMLKPFKPTKYGWMSGVMGWKGDWSFLSKGFNMARHAARFVGDQQYITYMIDKIKGADVRAVQSVLPGVYSYKRHIVGNGEVLPDDARIVCFHGLPLPEQVQCEWMEDYWC